MKNSTPIESEISDSAQANKIGEWRVVLFVASLFLLLELCFRVGGDALSKDIAHLKSFPKIANQLAEFKPEKGVRVLFLGNSLTRYGIDQQAFTETFQTKYNLQIQSVKMNPDNTDLADWFYAYRTNFAKRQINPDVVIVGFEGVHLRDAPSRHPDRLAQYYCSWEDYPELFQYDLKSFEERTHFSICKVSAAFGNRDRIQKRVLDLAIPNYRDAMDTLNNRKKLPIKKSDAEKQKAEKELKKPTYKKLVDFLKIAKLQKTQVILAAMPVPEAYQFDAEFLDIVKKTDAVLIDCRSVPGIKLPMFFDGLHMDEQAATLYSRYLAEKAGTVIKRNN